MCVDLTIFFISMEHKPIVKILHLFQAVNLVIE
jgi:hypothetical protein